VLLSLAQHSRASEERIRIRDCTWKWSIRDTPHTAEPLTWAYGLYDNIVSLFVEGRSHHSLCGELRCPRRRRRRLATRFPRHGRSRGFVAMDSLTFSKATHQSVGRLFPASTVSIQMMIQAGVFSHARVGLQDLVAAWVFISYNNTQTKKTKHVITHSEEREECSPVLSSST